MSFDLFIYIPLIITWRIIVSIPDCITFGYGSEPNYVKTWNVDLSHEKNADLVVHAYISTIYIIYTSKKTY